MVSQPELKKVSFSTECVGRVLTSAQYMDKRVLVLLNGSRKVTGNLRGYDVSCDAIGC